MTRKHLGISLLATLSLGLSPGSPILGAGPRDTQAHRRSQEATGDDLRLREKIRPAPRRSPAEHQKAEPAAMDLSPFLGTWLADESLPAGPDEEIHPVQRYLLLRLSHGKLQVKTLDYFPEKRARGQESGWNGTIILNSWNRITQTFTPAEDGTITVSLWGTDSVTPGPVTDFWWAVGKIWPEEQEGGPVLRYVTERGFHPTPRGNIWVPWDRTYKLVSREIDPKLARPLR
ncbi:MAG: hypothetical protein ACE5HD_04990, partial [Acidobacteriota bacterium]